MKKIAVYGSLLEGLHNSWYLGTSTKVSSEIVKIPYKMVSLGGFPALIPDEENNEIYVEIYEVDDAAYRNIEYLEGYPIFYQKADIVTSIGEVEVYVIENDKSLRHREVVTEGNWKSFIKEEWI